MTIGSAVLVDNAVFQLLQASAGAAASDRFNDVAYERGQICLRRGDTGLLFLTSAVVKGIRSSRDGRAVTLEVLGPGDTLGIESLLDSKGSREDFVVMDGGTALRLDASWARRMMLEEPAVSIAVSAELARRLRRTQDRSVRMRLRPASALVAEWVLDFGDTLPDRSELWQRSGLVTQDEVAEQIGISRETVNKALREFVLRGWVRKEGLTWAVLDRDAVERHAGRYQMARVAP